MVVLIVLTDTRVLVMGRGEEVDSLTSSENTNGASTTEEDSTEAFCREPACSCCCC